MCVLQLVKYQHIVEYVTRTTTNLKKLINGGNVCFCFQVFPGFVMFWNKKKKKCGNPEMYFLSLRKLLLPTFGPYGVLRMDVLISLGKWYLLLGSSDIINQIPSQEALIWPKCQRSHLSHLSHFTLHVAELVVVVVFYYFGSSQRTHIPLCTLLHDTSAAVSRRKKI